MSQDSKRLELLRQRRARLALDREKGQRRITHGPTIASAVGQSIGQVVTVTEFDTTRGLPVTMRWKEDLRQLDGLVAAYVSQTRAVEIARCCDAKFKLPPGVLGFDEYSFMGVLDVSGIMINQLVDISSCLADSVYFCPNGLDSIVCADYYDDRSSDREVGFTVVVQGEILERNLGPCFENVRQLGPSC